MTCVPLRGGQGLRGRHYVPGPLGLLDFLVPNLDLTVNHEGWETRDEIWATALSTIHERVLGSLLLEVILLLGAPRARV